MSGKKDGNEKKRREKKCRRCKTRAGLIIKYNLYICRRCFKEVAEKIGFKKYD